MKIVLSNNDLNFAEKVANKRLLTTELSQTMANSGKRTQAGVEFEKASGQLAFYRMFDIEPKFKFGNPKVDNQWVNVPFSCEIKTTNYPSIIVKPGMRSSDILVAIHKRMNKYECIGWIHAGDALRVGTNFSQSYYKGAKRVAASKLNPVSDFVEMLEFCEVWYDWKRIA